MNTDECIKIISGIVVEYLSQGLIPDTELLHFINSSYGLTDHEEIMEFISNGHDAGAVIDLLSCPSDTLRKSVEKFIPDTGIPGGTFEVPGNSQEFKSRYCIWLNGKKMFLSEQDSFFCFSKTIQRLNLDLGFTYLSELKESINETEIYDVRALLRKRKFISGCSNCLFVRDLIAAYIFTGSKNPDELLSLVNTACDLLNNSDRNPDDILSEKREYYKDAYMEALEFADLLRSYSMEFIMMKRIQPPLITAEEALSMMERISRLLSIVHGTGGSGFNPLF